MDNQVDFNKKRTEQELSSIGAKVADATDVAEKIERLSHLQEEKLEEAQEQLGNLYENLGETSVEVAQKPEPKKDDKKNARLDGTDG